MPLKHTKRKDYLRRQRNRRSHKDAPKFKRPITRRDILEEPEEGQKTL